MSWDLKVINFPGGSSHLRIGKQEWWEVIKLQSLGLRLDPQNSPPLHFRLECGQICSCTHIYAYGLFFLLTTFPLSLREGKRFPSSCFWSLVFCRQTIALSRSRQPPIKEEERKHEGQNFVRKMKISALLLSFPTMCCPFSAWVKLYCVIYRLIIYSFTHSEKVYLCMRVVIHLTCPQVRQKNILFQNLGLRFPF